MIRAKIQEKRLAKGFSVRKLALSTDMQVYQLGRYLDGTKGIGSKSLEKLFKILDINIK